MFYKYFYLLIILNTVFACFSKANAQENQEDLELIGALTDEFIRRPEVDSRLVEIKSIGGIISLTGQVETMLAKETASATALKMNEVRAVINLIDIIPLDFTDEELSEEINERLHKHKILGQQNIVAEVYGGIAELSGTVASANQLQMAENLAKAVPGILGTFNKLEINYPDLVSDEQIAQDVNFALEKDIVIDQTKLTVLVKNSVVHLSGPVVSMNKIPGIIRLSMVNGVDSVDVSELKVDELFPNRGVATEPRVFTDEDIFMAVSDAFLLDPRLEFFTPNIFVENQVITLGGVVNQLGIKIIATETASNVAGVWAVNNLMEIDPEAMRSDSAITENILSAIAFDPFLAGTDVIANVIDGTVQITGSVENYFQKGHATDIIVQIPGVVEVINNIVVLKTMRQRYDLISPLESYYQPVWWKNDFDLYNDIVDRIFWNPEIHEGDLSVEVSNGHVILRGIVDTMQQSIFIEQMCLAEGAMTVTNKLEVRFEMAE
jgi:osmotically-inducible protein OsmY